jgi:hypothetical protein
MPPNYNRPNPFQMFQGQPRHFPHQGGFFGNQMPGRQFGQTGNRGPGGLLAKLFKRTPKNTGFGPGFGAGGFGQGFGGQNFGGAVGGAGGLGKASSMLNNVQQMLNLAQQAAPMIQQYGPMVKNIPAFIQMWKMLNSSDDEETEEEEESVEVEEEVGEDTEKYEEESSNHDEELEAFLKDQKIEKKKRNVRENTRKRAKVKNNGQSTPKLFV